jgi:transposase
MHYAKKMFEWAALKKVYLFFNAPYSSKINMVEYAFEIVKR